jgi:hypothetical protein
MKTIIESLQNGIKCAKLSKVPAVIIPVDFV